MRIEKYNYELIYKLGKTNVVANALSRLPLVANMLTSSSETVHSADQDSTDLMPHYEAPLNIFKNQIILSEGKEMRAHEEPHPTYHRHYIRLEQISKDRLIEGLKEVLSLNIISGIQIPEQFIQLLQEIFREQFSKFRILIIPLFIVQVQDIDNEENKVSLIMKEHRRAHNYRENKEQILEKYYFPRITGLIKKYTVSK